MTPLLDEQLRPLKVGDKVEAKVCIGRYGQTRTVRGTIKEFTQYGGVNITLAEDTVPFQEYFKGFAMRPPTKAGDTYDISNAFEYDRKLKALMGKSETKDFEHGHTTYCRLLDEDAPPTADSKASPPA